MDYRALSNDHTFLICQDDGDFPPGGHSLGLYRDDMRFLSELRLLLDGKPLSVLSSQDDDVYHTTVLLTNEYFRTDAGERVNPHTISLRRDRVIADAVIERIVVESYYQSPLEATLTLEVGSDFVDLFQVRGFRIPTAGSYEAVERIATGVRLAYRGEDGLGRAVAVEATPTPDDVAVILPPPERSFEPLSAAGEEAASPTRFSMPEPVRAALSWNLALQPRHEVVLEVCYRPWEEAPPVASPEESPLQGALESDVPGEMERLRAAQGTGGDEADARSAAISGSTPTYGAVLREMSASYAGWVEGSTRVRTDNDDFNALLARSALDLRALVGTYPTGRLLVAGVPWYAVPFGRDSLITSLQTLCFRPELAVGALRFLAQWQATKDDPQRDEEPGKILHELRFGELARLGAVPHTPYYGSVDSTPLFVMLFAQTLRWTGDRGLYAELLPAVRRALEWCDNYGDLDGDGYIEYNRRSDGGIGNQGWKDSGDSLLRPNGENVTPPIALVEPQAYVHAAKAWLADVAAQMGDDAFAADLRAQAAELAERFNRDYWLPERGYYAQALDAEKRPIGDVTSNGGHALMCGIVPPDRAALISNRLLEQDMLSGWGVRTRSSLDPHYNPISYHNGSVWPHDNSLLAFGMGKVGERTAANVVAEQTLAVSREFRLARLPELLCGYSPSQTGGRPAEYPVSCSPQAWAAGSAFLLLQSILGLAPDALAGVLRLDPCLPEWLGAVEIENLQVGEAKVSLRVGADGVEVIASDGVEVVVAS